MAATDVELVRKDAKGSRWRPRNVVAVGLVVLLVALAWQHRWTFEDGFINFRIVKQLEAGRGPVFNRGQRVEAYTSPLWLFTLALFDVLTPIRIEWVSVFLGIAFTAIGLAMSIAASRRLWAGIDERAREVPLGALVLVVTAPIWYFATSGLEGGLTFAWLGALLWVLANWGTRSRPLSRPEWVLIGLGWLIRPELLLFSLAAAIGVVVAEQSDRSLLRRIRATGWAWILPVGYEIFRMGYFASLLPNTAYAKTASGARWDKGWQYLSQFVNNYWLWLPILVLVIAGYLPLVRKLRPIRDGRFAIAIIWLIATAVTTLYIVRVGGDYIDARLLLPSWFAFCGPIAVSRVSTPPRAVAYIALAAWVTLAATSLRPDHTYQTTFDDHRKNVVTLTDALQPPSIEAYVYSILKHANFTYELYHITAKRNPALPKRTFVLGGIGVVGYMVGINAYVLDVGGLADPIVARFELPSRGLPGHEKFEPAAWSAARLLAPGVAAPPVLQKTPVFFQPLIPLTSGADFDRQVAEARRALQCGDLRGLQQAVQGNLTIGGFLSNIAHSFTYTRLTIPPDPAAAEMKFCGHVAQ